MNSKLLSLNHLRERKAKLRRMRLKRKRKFVDGSYDVTYNEHKKAKSLSLLSQKVNDAIAICGFFEVHKQISILRVNCV